MDKEVVAILGASNSPDRYSYMAMELLKKYNHTPLLVNPRIKKILGQKCYATLDECQQENPKIDTLTIYVNEKVSTELMEEILSLKIKRAIFNPGSENEKLEKKLNEKGIETLRACTLVLLKTDQF